MTQPINLNKVRKAQTRAADKARADANAVKHGRTKAQRLLEAAQDEKAARQVSQHKFEDE